ncbi:SDR family NAD(P)-dependent oxidoreductase [Candidatus Poribacteria bacterium]|nr:SDR family NAD(P)-dependent oxidoreductase [Candidatus Poribacteria bacterium]
MNLKGQVAIVTGGGRGIGRATALALAESGVSIAVVARTESEIEAVARSIVDKCGHAIAVKTDVTKEDQVEAMVQKVIDHFGKVDILINNAGYAKHAYIHEVDTDVWNTTMNVNLTGVMFCTRAVFRHMMKRKSGYIINISSGAGKRGSYKYSVYSTSKFGVMGFTECVAAEGIQHDIKVSVICPGPVATRMRASNHPGEDPTGIMQARDIADVALFLINQPKRAYIREVAVSIFPT